MEQKTLYGKIYIPKKSTKKEDGIDDCERCALNPEICEHRSACFQVPCIKDEIYYIEQE